MLPSSLQEKTSSDELASDILSAISNEECSVGSEILDKPVESDLQDFVAASILQVVFSLMLFSIDSTTLNFLSLAAGP